MTRAMRRAAAAFTMAVLASAGCGEDDGVSVMQPIRGVQGLWVRYAPPVNDVGSGGDMAPVPFDSILIAGDDGGWWSREVRGSTGIEPLRYAEPVRMAQKGTGLYLERLGAPCPSCRLQVDERLTELPTIGVYRVRRPDADHIELVPLAGDVLGGREHYVRRPTPRVLF